MNYNPVRQGAPERNIGSPAMRQPYAPTLSSSTSSNGVEPGARGPSSTSLAASALSRSAASTPSHGLGRSLRTGTLGMPRGADTAAALRASQSAKELLGSSNAMKAAGSTAGRAADRADGQGGDVPTHGSSVRTPANGGPHVGGGGSVSTSASSRPSASPAKPQRNGGFAVPAGTGAAQQSASPMMQNRAPQRWSGLPAADLANSLEAAMGSSSASTENGFAAPSTPQPPSRPVRPKGDSDAAGTAPLGASPLLAASSSTGSAGARAQSRAAGSDTAELTRLVLNGSRLTAAEALGRRAQSLKNLLGASLGEASYSGAGSLGNSVDAAAMSSASTPQLQSRAPEFGSPHRPASPTAAPPPATSMNWMPPAAAAAEASKPPASPSLGSRKHFPSPAQIGESIDTTLSSDKGEHAARSPSADDANYARSLRARDDEIVRLKEQVRIVSRRNSTVGDADTRRLSEENSELRQHLAQLQKAFKERYETSKDMAPATQGQDEPTTRMGVSSLAATLMGRGQASAPKQSFAQGKPTEAGVVQLESENAKLKAENADLQTELVRMRERTAGDAGSRSGSKGPQAAPKGAANQQSQQRPPGSTSRGSPMLASVVQLQRQLKDQDEERQSLDDMLKAAQAEIVRLQGVALQLQTQQARALNDEPIAGDDLLLGSRKGNHAKPGQRAADMYQMLAAAHEEKQKLQEEARQRWELLRHEREQWRREREGLLAEQRRRDKTEETLRRQNAAVQERLDNLQLNEAAKEQERRLSRVQQGGSPDHDKRLSKGSPTASEAEKPQVASDDRAQVDRQKVSQQLELQIEQQTISLARLRGDVQHLEKERQEACSLLMAGKQQLSSSMSTPALRQPPIAAAAPNAYERHDDRQSLRGRGRGRGRTGLGAGAGAPSRRGPAASSSNSYARGGSASRAPAPGMGLSRSASSILPQNSSIRSLTPPIVPSLNLSSHFGSAMRELTPPSKCGDGASTDDVSSYIGSSDESSTGSSSAATERRKRTQASVSAVFGDAPLQKVAGLGWYFRLRINSDCSNWLGGFAIGVTLSSPSTLVPLPDRAARVPRSWLAGYWGRTFANGQERLSTFSPQALKPGDEVVFLVGLEGECSVFVNDEETCRFSDPPVPVVRPGGGDVEITALIDVSAAVTSVTFVNGGPPPAAALLRNQQLGRASETSAPGYAGLSAAANGKAAAPTTATMVANASGVYSPAPPPPSPLCASLVSLNHARANSPMQPHRQGTSSPPVPPLNLGRSPTPPANAAVAAAAAAAVRRVPPLALPVPGR